MIVGVDKGKYKVNVGTRKITLSKLGFKPTIEGLLYVLNETQGIIYYAAAASFLKATIVGNDIIYDNQPTFPILVKGDKIHIQIKEPDSESITKTTDLEGTETFNDVLKQLKIMNLHLAILTDSCINTEDIESCRS
ncbi:MAG: hypothetical protein KAS32_14620 [Candidatus Peribacteraceae bacterium]|nr:hypothetical protein [Candidatus Peribacteraceae bacterium]